jgi:type IV secretory pathway VirB2 component (pilin)
MQNESLSKIQTLIVVGGMLAYFGVGLAAQSPFDQQALAIDRALHGVLPRALAGAVVVLSGMRMWAGGGARWLPGVVGGLAVVFFSDEILAWLFHV